MNLRTALALCAALGCLAWGSASGASPTPCAQGQAAIGQPGRAATAGPPVAESAASVDRRVPALDALEVVRFLDRMTGVATIVHRSADLVALKWGKTCDPKALKS